MNSHLLPERKAPSEKELARVYFDGRTGAELAQEHRRMILELTHVGAAISRGAQRLPWEFAGLQSN